MVLALLREKMDEKFSENLRTIRRPMLERKYEELLTASAIKQHRR